MCSDRYIKDDKNDIDIDFDSLFEPALKPLVDCDDDEVTVKTCMHLKKRKVKFLTFEYWYCPTCKKEVKECK